MALCWKVIAWNCGRDISDIARKQAEENFVEPQEAFLESLGMTLTIFPAREEDLARAEELPRRTHQLNTTALRIRARS